MDISRAEQRVLHLLAQGGWISIEKDQDGRAQAILCYNRDGWRAPPCAPRIFRKLKRLRALRSRDGGGSVPGRGVGGGRQSGGHRRFSVEARVAES